MLTIEEVRSALQAEEPRYGELAEKFGPEALPHLRELIGGVDPLLASKATYLAAMIGRDEASPLVRQAAANPDPTVRVAAAAASKMFQDEIASEVLLPLVTDIDAGVQKVALRSTPRRPSLELYSRIETLGTHDKRDVIRKATRDAMDRVNKPKQ